MFFMSVSSADLLEGERSPGFWFQVGFTGHVVDEAGGFVAPILVCEEIAFAPAAPETVGTRTGVGE